MEFFLLGAGALVLVGITLWIVWPARTVEPVGGSASGVHVAPAPVAESWSGALPPQGDRFEDQYTSATADLSAGGVAAALEAMHEPVPVATPSLPPPRVALPLPAPARVPVASPGEPGSLAIPSRTLGVGAGAALVVGGGVGGAWLYARWQRQRNKPINRLRRGARGVASRLGERLPEVVDELPYSAAPVSGAATALVLAALVVARALRREPDDFSRDVRNRGLDASRQLRARLSDVDVPSMDTPRKPAVMGIGVGGMALVAGGAFAVWKLLRRGQPDRSTWYVGE